MAAKESKIFVPKRMCLKAKSLKTEGFANFHLGPDDNHRAVSMDDATSAQPSPTEPYLCLSLHLKS